MVAVTGAKLSAALQSLSKGDMLAQHKVRQILFHRIHRLSIRHDHRTSVSLVGHEASRGQNAKPFELRRCVIGRRNAMSSDPSPLDAPTPSPAKRQVEPPDVIDLAARARLAVSAEEMEGYKESLGRIVEWFSQLQEIDVEGVEPAIRVGGAEEESTLRADVPVQFPERAALMAQVPELEGPYLRIPKVLADNPDE